MATTRPETPRASRARSRLTSATLGMSSPMKPFTAVAVTLATLALVGCGVDQTEAPPLTGPSDLALSISVVAVPDSINQDGGSQSSIKVTAFGPNGKGQANVAIRLAMRVLVTAPAPCP